MLLQFLEPTWRQKERNEPTKLSDVHMNVVWYSQAHTNHTHNINDQKKYKEQ